MVVDVKSEKSILIEDFIRSNGWEGLCAISVQQAANKLGLARHTVSRAIKKDKFPHIEVGDRILVPLYPFAEMLIGYKGGGLVSQNIKG